MCLLSFRWQQAGKYRLLLVANRDEFYERPTAAMQWWPESQGSEVGGVLAGRDLRAGGTWMGVNRLGQFAALTNFREIPNPDARWLSRGELVSGFLQASNSAAEFAAEISDAADQYAGFNLLVGDQQQLFCISNRSQQQNSAQALLQVPAGLHGLSNAYLNTPWVKVCRARDELSALPADLPLASYLPVLSSRERIAIDQVPDTGVDAQWEQLLSSQFIVLPSYGTRIQTVLRMDYQGQVELLEREFDEAGEPVRTREFRYQCSKG